LLLAWKLLCTSELLLLLLLQAPTTGPELFVEVLGTLAAACDALSNACSSCRCVCAAAQLSLWLLLRASAAVAAAGTHRVAACDALSSACSSCRRVCAAAQLSLWLLLLLLLLQAPTTGPELFVEVLGTLAAACDALSKDCSSSSNLGQLLPIDELLRLLQACFMPGGWVGLFVVGVLAYCVLLGVYAGAVRGKCSGAVHCMCQRVAFVHPPPASRF
jgi:hypothetical protein